MQQACSEPYHLAPIPVGMGCPTVPSIDVVALLRAGAKARTITDGLEHSSVAAFLIGEHSSMLHVSGLARAYPADTFPLGVRLGFGNVGGEQEIRIDGEGEVVISAPVRIHAADTRPFWCVMVSPSVSCPEQLVKTIAVLGRSEKRVRADARLVGTLMQEAP